MTAVQAVAAAQQQPTAVITGCSTGIGRESALLLAQKGWTVFAGARSQADLAQLGQLHGGITPVALDVTSQESVAAAQQLVADSVGPAGVQLLVNNAGICTVAPVEFFDLASFREVMEVNFMGAVATSQAFIPLLRSGQHKGRIVNVSSVAGHLTMPAWSAYCSSKHALESFSECLRYELQQFGVAVVVVKPGPVATPLWAKGRARSTSQADPARLAAAQAVYGGMMDGMSEMTRKSEAKAVPVEEAVAVIYEAATSRNPQSLYHVGNSRATWLAKRLLPDQLWQGLLGGYFSKAFSAAAAQGSGSLQEQQ